jgi:hypothetical protein
MRSVAILSREPNLQSHSRVGQQVQDTLYRVHTSTKKLYTHQGTSFDTWKIVQKIIFTFPFVLYVYFMRSYANTYSLSLSLSFTHTHTHTHTHHTIVCGRSITSKGSNVWFSVAPWFSASWLLSRFIITHISLQKKETVSMDFF